MRGKNNVPSAHSVARNKGKRRRALASTQVDNRADSTRTEKFAAEPSLLLLVPRFSVHQVGINFRTNNESVDHSPQSPV